MTVRQMCGRAGRPKIKDGRTVLAQGDAYILLPEAEFNALQDEYARVGPVLSRLDDVRTLAFHVISEISQGRVVDAASFADWHSRSLAHAQGRVLERSAIEEVFSVLRRLKAIQTSDDGETYVVTNLGRLSCAMYFSPWMVCGWFINFSRLFGSKATINSVTAPWALCNVRDYAEGVAGAGDSAGAVVEFRSACSKQGLRVDKQPAVVGTAYRALMQGKRLSGLAGLQGQLLADLDRVAAALSLMEKMCAPHWRHGKWAELAARVRYGLPAGMAGLARIDGIGGKRARIIWDCGVRTPSQLVSRTEAHDKLRARLGPKIFDSALISAAAIAKKEGRRSGKPSSQAGL